MIFGIGCDIIELDRIKNTYSKHGMLFLKRIYSDQEIDYCLSHKNPIPSLAARFAAKEATAKALGVGIGSLFTWHDSSILSAANGKPTLLLSESCLSHFGPLLAHITLSHSQSHAMAMVVLEKDLS
jgi:holo-[acyl-carrier protein] synthase